MTAFLAITISILAIVAYVTIGIRARHWVAPRAIAWKYDHPSYLSSFEENRRKFALEYAGPWIKATVCFWPITVPTVWHYARTDPDRWEKYAPWAVKQRDQKIRQLESELGIGPEDGDRW